MSPKTQKMATKAPKDMVVTRRKSAMQRRQLRNKDRSMKALTQLLKSPTRNTQSPRKPKLSPKPKSPKKKPVSKPAPSCNQDLIARRPKPNRVWLQPKPNFKMVAKTNKRKLCTPHRELSPPPAPPSPRPLRWLVEAAELSDADMLEILTCPSPVWWEDEYQLDEDPICTMANEVYENDKLLGKSTSEILNRKCDDEKYVNKRKNLENLLDVIKKKQVDDNDGDNNEMIDKDLINDEMLKTLENIDIPIENVNNEEKFDNTNDKSTNEVAINNDVNELVNVPDKLPTLQRNPMHLASQNDNNEKQNENENVNNDVTKMISAEQEKCTAKDLDTISDSNIKFIDNVEDKELDDTSQMILDKIKKFFHDKDKKNNKKEYITVYQIVDNEDKQELKNDDKSKINYFYKKCKNVRRINEKDSSKSDNKTLALPNSEVKYCFKCSSIFETKECRYCAMAETKECVCDETQANKCDLSNLSG